MQLNMTTEYAMRALVFLRQREGVHTLETIAKKMDIPAGYLVKIMRLLKKHGLIETRQGINGGYCLGMNAEHCSLYDILQITEKTIKINYCLEEGKCTLTGMESKCRTGVHEIYRELQDVFELRMKKVTLDELASGVSLKEVHSDEKVG